MDKIILNDNNPILIGLYRTFITLGADTVLNMVDSVIEEYGLSDSFRNGHYYYKCGLTEYNREPYQQLRENVNRKKTNKDHNYYIMLYVLIVYSFNNQIRFNTVGDFNTPVGQRDFNKNMRIKLETFINRLSNSKYCLENNDFRDFDTSRLTKDSFVYCDPSYLITCATYNEQNNWNEHDEKDLLQFLDRLHDKGIRFALSNVLTHNGKNNSILNQWANQYHITHLNYNYSNCNYQKRNINNTITDEVLIRNY